jgi:hypothetical protein
MGDVTRQRATNGSAARGGPGPRRSDRDRPRRGAASWSPFFSGSTYDREEDRYWLDREISLLERALMDKGEIRRSELGTLVGCKYWGPGRFARALRAGVEQGRIKHTGFGRYGPARIGELSGRSV